MSREQVAVGGSYIAVSGVAGNQILAVRTLEGRDMNRRVLRPSVVPLSNARSLSSWLKLLLVLCAFIQVTALAGVCSGRQGNTGNAAVAPAPGNSSTSPTSVGDCSKTGSKLTDQQVCGDLLGRIRTVQVPEPSSLFLVGCGLLLMAALLRRRFRLKSPESADR
jgi:hypothetical protein